MNAARYRKREANQIRAALEALQRRLISLQSDTERDARLLAMDHPATRVQTAGAKRELERYRAAERDVADAIEALQEPTP